jgi:hypothetical protein
MENLDVLPIYLVDPRFVLPQARDFSAPSIQTRVDSKQERCYRRRGSNGGGGEALEFRTHLVTWFLHLYACPVPLHLVILC